MEATIESGFRESGTAYVPRGSVRSYLLAGVALGIGAPLGFLALQRIVRHRTWRVEFRAGTAAYLYMSLATPFFFGLFGGILGTQQEKLRRSHLSLEHLRDEFGAVVAHDLRNPVQNILLQLDHLLGHSDGDRVVVPIAVLRRLHAGGERLSGMIDDLLDSARIEASRLRIDLARVPLAEALEALVERIAPMLKGHSVELRIEDRPCVLADPGRLDQIATNLIENATKYSEEGTTIVVRVFSEAGGGSFSVEDRGPGITTAEMPRLFDRFYQATRARAKKSGLGLGLYITKGLVDAQKGCITVESEVDRGSTFTVCLPAAPELS